MKSDDEDDKQDEGEELQINRLKVSIFIVRSIIYFTECGISVDIPDEVHIGSGQAPSKITVNVDDPWFPWPNKEASYGLLFLHCWFLLSHQI